MSCNCNDDKRSLGSFIVAIVVTTLIGMMIRDSLGGES